MGKEEKEYRVVIGSGDEALILTTDTRKLGRGAYELCQENGIACEVTKIGKPKVVKFAGLITDS